MRDEKLYTVSWTQVYEAWPVEPKEQEQETMDLTQAREVLARIMSK